MNEAEFALREIVQRIHKKGLKPDTEIIAYLKEADLPSFVKCIVAGHLLSNKAKAIMAMRNIGLLAIEDVSKDWFTGFIDAVLESSSMPEEKVDQRTSREFAETAPTDLLKNLARYVDSVLFINPGETLHMVIDQRAVEEFCEDIFLSIVEFADNLETN